MAITYVGVASAESSSVSLPSHENGDFAIVFAYNTTSTSTPTLASGWTNIATNAFPDGSRLAYRFLLSSDTSTGTFTNADRIGVVVYRGVHNAFPFDSSQPTIDGGSSSTFFMARTTSTIGQRYSTSLSVHLGITAGTNTGAKDYDTANTTNRTSGLTSQVFGACDGSLSSSEQYNLAASSDMAMTTLGLREQTNFPIVIDSDTTSGTVTSNSSSWTLTYPTNIAAGDLLLAFVASDGASGAVTSMPEGWILLGAGNGANSLTAAKKLATGSETGTFSVGLGNSEQGAWVIYRIPAETWYGTVGTDFSNAANSASVELTQTSGNDSTPDPPSLNPANWAAEDTLWFAVCSVDTSRDITAYPSSPDTFTNTGKLVSGGSNGASLGYARLEKNASSVDPGTFTIATSDDSLSYTIAVRPKQIIRNFAQAQASIIVPATTVRVHAQSQAHILIISKQFAQAQTRIVSKYEIMVKSIGPLSYWKFDEKSGATIAKDIVGAVDGTYSGTPIFEVTAESGLQDSTAVSFDSSDYVDMGNVYGFTSGPFTVMGWFKLSSFAQDYQFLIGKSTSHPSTSGWAMVFWGPSKDPELRINNTYYTPNSELPDLVENTWFFFVATNSPTLSRAGLHVNEYKRVLTETSITPASNAVSLRVARSSDNLELPVGTVSLDEIAFFNKEVSYDDIQALYTLAKSGAIVRPAQAQAQITTGVTTVRVHAQSQADIKTAYNAYGQSQSDIKQVYNGYAQGQADIKQTYSTFAQAQTQILAIGKSFGQSQADIKATSNAFTQAQSDIKQTYQAYGQSNSNIKQSYKVFAQAQACIRGTAFAQAQADIKQTYNGFAQSQADIKNFYKVSAQAQSEIKQRYTGSAQAQSDIKQIYNGFGQTQSDIKQAYKVSGQAQANIKQTYAVHSQAQSDIKQTYDSFAQAQASTVQQYNAYGQAQGQTKQTYNAFAQTQANILQIYQAYAQALGDIKQTYNVFAQSEAKIVIALATYEVYAQAQTNILQAYHGFAQAIASIKVLNINAHAQTQSSILTSYITYAQAQSTILQIYQAYGQTQGQVLQTYQAYGQALSKIAVLVWFDDFNRTVSSGLGLNYSLNFSTSGNWESSVNGSSTVFPSGKWENVALPVAAFEGTVQFDVWIPNVPASTGYRVGVQLAGSDGAYNSNYGVKISENSATEVAIWVGTGGGHWAIVPITAGSWHTFKANIYRNGGSAKIWKIGDTEPDWQLQVFSYGAAPNLSAVNASFINWEGWTNEASSIDNLYIWSSSPTRVWRFTAQSQAAIKQSYQNYGQAQAYILTQNNAYGQAQASILQSYLSYAQAEAKLNAFDVPVNAQAQAWIEGAFTVFAQAEAKINAFDVPVHGQAQASILTNYQGYAQAEAWIEITANGYANAQADIQTTYDAYGQAQGSIKTTYEAVAQAQATVRGNAHAQAQADIKNVYNGFAQAQVNILASTQVYAQAQATVLQAYTAHGQAQADIKQTYSEVGQAQSDILQSYQEYAQAQADILQVYQGYGQTQAYIVVKDIVVVAQTQADILQSYQGYAQAEAFILLSGLSAYGNAQALILQSYQVSAQAEARLISFDYPQHAQAQAWMSGAEVAFAQAQSTIHAYGINAYGQAQANILQTYTVTANAQATILAAYQGYAQAQSNILQTYQGYGQAQGQILQIYQGYAQSAAQILQTTNSYAQTQGSIKNTYDAYGQAEAKINAFDVSAHAQAQAWIAGAQIAFAQAEASIKAVSNGYGQTQAQILQAYQGYAQAEANILASYQGYAQAEALIGQMYQEYAQAQGTIKATSDVFGQAQSDVKQVYSSYAQAQSAIKQIYDAYAQAQGTVISSNQGYAQAQGTILSTNREFAQATAGILQIYAVVAQTQAIVKQAYQGYAQSEAWIVISLQAYAQSEARILSVYDAYGQAQTDILQTYIVTAQSLALIVVTGNVTFAQAQADIKTEYLAYAQAFALIQSGNVGYAQAQAYIIRINENVFAQSEALIIKAAGYANAQAFIRVEFLLQWIEISDQTIGLVLSDVLSSNISLTVNDYGISLILSDFNYDWEEGED